MQKVINPVPVFLNSSGTLLNGGRLYLGVANADPAVSPVNAFYDSDMTILAAQPIKILGGRTVNESLAPASIYVAEADYSIRVSDTNDAQIEYTPSVASESVTYQPVDGDLTAIAALGTTAFGRSLLTLADANALKTATGIPASVPASGGTFTGQVKYIGNGPYMYIANPDFAYGTVAFGPLSAGDPTSLPGQVWMYWND